MIVEAVDRPTVTGDVVLTVGAVAVLPKVRTLFPEATPVRANVAIPVELVTAEAGIVATVVVEDDA